MAIMDVKNLCKAFHVPHDQKTTLFENLVGMMRPNQYETFTVLRDINFEVEEGDSMGIIGHNGSGKSILLKIVANILRPTRGSVRIKGKITPFLELGVGFQPDLTMRENIRIRVYAAIMGLSNREIAGRIDEILYFAGLKKFEDTRLKNLSSGLQVRLAFSTAIQTDPDILLVDEVLAVGDMELQQKCFEVFERYKRDRATILFVSHGLSTVRRFCNKTLLLRGGRAIEVGGTNKIIDKYIYKSDKIAEKTTVPEEIISVKFVDKNNKERDNFILGDPIIVRIFYQSNEKVISSVFRIIFYWQNTYCYGTTIEFRGYDTGHLLGKGCIDFKADRLPLLSGKYDVTVAVTSQDYKKQYDWHDRLYSFNVHNPTRGLGILSMECRWVV